MQETGPQLKEPEWGSSQDIRNFGIREGKLSTIDLGQMHLLNSTKKYTGHPMTHKRIQNTMSNMSPFTQPAMISTQTKLLSKG